MNVKKTLAMAKVAIEDPQSLDFTDEETNERWHRAVQDAYQRPDHLRMLMPPAQFAITCIEDVLAAMRPAGHRFTVNGVAVPDGDAICECGHWYDEHDQPEGGSDEDAFCAAPECECDNFRFSETNPEPVAIADRGGDPSLWPAHVKAALVVPVEVGKEYRFFAEVEEEYLEPEKRLRNYTGQMGTVIGIAYIGDEETSPRYHVRFPDGRVIEAHEEELSGWDESLGQFFGPSGKHGDPS